MGGLGGLGAANRLEALIETWDQLCCTFMWYVAMSMESINTSLGRVAKLIGMEVTVRTA